MSELSSAAVPPVGPDDHGRGEGEELVVYADLGCPQCAVAWDRIRVIEARLVFRHFPVSSKHPRSPALHAAAEAAALQQGTDPGQAADAFFDLVDSLFADRGRVDDPHLWERAKRLGLDIERFEADRRSEPVAERVRRDFQSGIRAGVVETPALFRAGQGVDLDQLTN